MRYLQDPDVTLYHGDVLAVLRELPAASVDCCVTSPPYWGLRDYGTGAWEGGDERCDHLRQSAVSRESSTLVGSTDTQGGTYAWGATCGKCGATRMVEVFREVRRVLASHGTVWLNLGDSYSTQMFTRQGKPRNVPQPPNDWAGTELGDRGRAGNVKLIERHALGDMKAKDLCGIPWMVAFALRADGWYLRSDIIWAKPNPMPESVTDRPTKAHEYVFLLSKQPRYFFDQEAVREAYEATSVGNWSRKTYEARAALGNSGTYRREYSQPMPSDVPPQIETLDGSEGEAARGPDGRRNTHVEAADGSIQHRDGERWPNGGGRNIRSVWEIATQPYPEAHFATFPEELARRCIAAGCPEQVCRSCGKARERVLEKEATGRIRQREKAGLGVQTSRESHGLEAVGGQFQEGVVYKTAGFTDCNHADYRPGIVLDPFMGSGTVAYVARKLDRRSIGIDLSAEYLELAARRLQQQSLFADALVLNAS